MLRKTLGRLVKFGRLTVIGPNAAEVQFGEVKALAPRPDVAVRLKGVLTPWKLALHPDLYFGELYMEGALVLERGTLWDLLELLGRSLAEQKRLPGNPAAAIRLQYAETLSSLARAFSGIPPQRK